MAIFYALVALCLSGRAFAQIITSGDCPKVELQKNLQLSRYTGIWYIQERFFTLYETGSKCGVFDYHATDESPTLTHNVTSSITGKTETYVSPVIIPDPGEPARMLRQAPRSPINNHEMVLGTDYDNWAVVHGCNVLCTVNLQYVWVLSRAQVPDESVVATARAVLEKNNIDTSQLIKVEQEKCSNEPETGYTSTGFLQFPGHIGKCGIAKEVGCRRMAGNGLAAEDDIKTILYKALAGFDIRRCVVRERSVDLLFSNPNSYFDTRKDGTFQAEDENFDDVEDVSTLGTNLL